MKEGGEGGREEVTIRGWKEMRCGAGNVNHLVMCTYILTLMISLLKNH